MEESDFLKVILLGDNPETFRKQLSEMVHARLRGFADGGIWGAINSVSAAGNGLTSTDGSTISYTPNVSFSGQDTFTYIITDGSALSLAATVTVNVVAANTAPVAVADSVTVIAGNTDVPIAVLANDSDLDVGARPTN